MRSHSANVFEPERSCTRTGSPPRTRSRAKNDSPRTMVLRVPASNHFDFADVSCSAREKSQPRNGAGEIFITAAAEIGRETVSATNRVGRVRLTRGNVGGSRRPGNKTPETGLPGWANRIRTSAWRNQKPFLFGKKQRLSRLNSGNPAISGQTLTRILANLARRRSKI